MDNRPMKTIFSMKLAGILMQRGFVLVDMTRNQNNSGKNVFFFYDSPELESVIDDFANKRI